MLCSACSKPVEPIAVCDIDGTLAMYHESLTNFAANYFDRVMPPVPYQGDTPFRDYLGLTQQEHRAVKLAYRQGGNKRFLPAYPGATEFVQGLKAMGCEIWFATTRPFQRLDNIDPDTMEWLRRNHMPVDGLLYGEDKYEQLVATVDKDRIIACFEDLTPQIALGNALGLPMFQVARPHNTGISRANPGGSLTIGLSFATHRLERWNAKHG